MDLKIFQVWKRLRFIVDFLIEHFFYFPFFRKFWCYLNLLTKILCCVCSFVNLVFSKKFKILLEAINMFSCSFDWLRFICKTLFTLSILIRILFHTINRQINWKSIRFIKFWAEDTESVEWVTSYVPSEIACKVFTTMDNWENKEWTVWYFDDYLIYQNDLLEPISNLTKLSNVVLTPKIK